MLEHGGNLSLAVARYGIARDEWLDLSTGINPQPYPVPALCVEDWQRLPECNGALTQAACACYGSATMLPVAGSQAAIQALPLLRLRNHGLAHVVMATPSYAEHGARWVQAGHLLQEVCHADLTNWVERCDVMVICNPNNPTGAMLPPAMLREWAQRLAWRGGWLVVDEAFVDSTPQSSTLVPGSHPEGLIVLRSFGKFFGLAGVRLGFVAAEASLLLALQEWLGPWSVSTPAQQIGLAALSDLHWQTTTRARLLSDGARLQNLLRQHGIVSSGSALFQWWMQPAAAALHAWMAQQGIWVRLFNVTDAAIRIGLPPDETGWKRLQQALQGWQTHASTISAESEKTS
jgi:cobalamin biosynthesis protein CobC